MEDIKGKRITLIGGAGFIGHNLALTLRQMGAEVSVIDGLEVNNWASVIGNKNCLPFPRLSRSMLNARFNLLNDADIPLLVQDARDYHEISKLLNYTDPQVVIHLAAVSHANRSNKDPYSTFDHSLRTLENALDNAKGRIEHFIFFSSSMVYGNFTEGIVYEDTRCEPLGIYGALKYAGEKMVIAYNQVFDLPYTIIRPSALYGERCISRRVGQIFIENAIFGREIVISGDGSDSLDFTYIRDLTNGVIDVIRHPAARNETFNLTFGGARSIGEMVELLRNAFGHIEVRKVEKDALTPDRGTLSIEKARSLIGYEPSWPLETGYPEYIRWYQTFMNEHPELLESVV